MSIEHADFARLEEAYGVFVAETDQAAGPATP